MQSVFEIDGLILNTTENILAIEAKKNKYQNE